MTRARNVRDVMLTLDCPVFVFPFRSQTHSRLL